VEATDPSLSAWLHGVDYAGVVVVGLGYRIEDVPRPLDGYGYLVTRAEGLATLGVVWESSLFPGRAPEGAALLRVVMGGCRRPDVVNGSDQRKAALARDELRKALGIRAEPCHTSIFTWPRAIAQFTLGHNDRRASLRDRLQRHPGLAVCGTSYDGVSFNHAVQSGQRTAHNLAEQLWGDHGRASALADLAAGA